MLTRKGSNPAIRLSGERLEARQLMAADVQLLRDVNQTPLDLEPGFLGVAGDYAYFRAADNAHGSELWRTDGTTAGTQLVRDLQPGWRGSDPQVRFFMPAGNLAFLRAWSPGDSDGLWVTDGSTAGTKLLSNMPPDSGGAVFFHDRLYYSSNGTIWSSDGTPEGTSAWRGLSGSGLRFAQSGMQVLNGSLIFAAYSAASDRHYLMKSDGTAAAAVKLAEVRAELQFGATGVVGDNLRFFAHAEGGAQLWETDGTAEGTKPISNQVVGFAQETAVLGQQLFFTFDAANSTREMWVSDGTDAGTHLVNSGAYPTRLAATERVVMFDNSSPENGRELWTSDGTVAGTHLVKDVREGPADSISYGSPPAYAAGSGDKYYFSADDGHGSRLWSSDGTEAGTQKVSDQNDGLTSQISFLGGRLVLDAGTPGLGREMWISDGTDAGTAPLTVGLMGRPGALPSAFVPAGNQSFFTADDGVHGRELWVTDGTAAGAHLVMDINEGPGDGVGVLPGLVWSDQVVVGNVLFFVAFDPEHGLQPWRTDGTAAGTFRLANTWVGRIDQGRVSDFVAVGNTVYFAARGFNAGSLWKTDGTVAGTVLVAENVAPTGLVDLGGKLFFIGWQGLMTSDGTAAGTVPVIRSPAFQSFAPMTAALGKLFFSGDANSSGRQLWVSDGTLEGTKQVKVINSGGFSAFPSDFVELDGYLYFKATNGQGFGLWRTDGTTAGTTLIKPPLAGKEVSFLNRLGDRLTFVFDNKLWVSNGTAVGTFALQDGLELYLRGSAISLDDVVYFLGDDGQGTMRLWQQSGAEGKSLVELPKEVADLSGIGVVGSRLAVMVLNLTPSVSGDANGDGRVDLMDFGVLKANFGTGASRAQGDFNGDWRVDLTDFGILKAAMRPQGAAAFSEPIQSPLPRDTPLTLWAVDEVLAAFGLDRKPRAKRLAEQIEFPPQTPFCPPRLSPEFVGFRDVVD